MIDNGYIYEREVPEVGLVINVAPMIFNDRILVSKIGDKFSYLDAWCYDKGGSAIEAAEAFDLAAGQTEPVGWKKHPATGRYREGGDPAKERTNP